jgi:hypothetical protein
MGAPSDMPRLSPVLRASLLPILALHAVLPVMWLVAVSRNGPAPNDWLHLKIVADHFVAGDWGHLYDVGEQMINPGYYWRYPPFALYLVAPLAWLPESGAYSLLSAVEIVALVWSVVLLYPLVRDRRMHAEWVLAVVLSAPAVTTIMTGQSSALMLLCVAGAGRLWTAGRVVPACAMLGLFALKPNWGIAFGLLAIARGEWKGVAAMVGVVLGLCALSVPLGAQIWSDFIGMSLSNDVILEGYEPQKLITLKAFFEGLLGSGTWSSVLWAAAALGLLATAVVAWRAPGPPFRHLGIALLLAVAVNPYASFYDALLLALPATMWWAEQKAWPRGPWLVVGGGLALAWCAEHWTMSWSLLLGSTGPLWLPPVSVVGPVTAVWLMLASRQALTADRKTAATIP